MRREHPDIQALAECPSDFRKRLVRRIGTHQIEKSDRPLQRIRKALNLSLITRGGHAISAETEQQQAAPGAGSIS